MEKIENEDFLTDDGQIVNQLKRSGCSDKEIEIGCQKFGVTYHNQNMSIKVDQGQLKMAKDRILQAVLLMVQ